MDAHLLAVCADYHVVYSDLLNSNSMNWRVEITLPSCLGAAAAVLVPRELSTFRVYRPVPARTICRYARHWGKLTAWVGNRTHPEARACVTVRTYIADLQDETYKYYPIQGNPKVTERELPRLLASTLTQISTGKCSAITAANTCSTSDHQITIRHMCIRCISLEQARASSPSPGSWVFPRHLTSRQRFSAL